MNPTPTIATRYEAIRHIQDGGQGATTLAIDKQSGEYVVLKRLHMDRLEDWKHVELFERETTVLKRLQHPSIPTYIDAFHEPESNANGYQLVLVQEYIQGTDLEQAINNGLLRMNEALARQIAREILEILDYLHCHTPPLIHRDLKPANLIRNHDGRLYLVDFGAVQQSLTATPGRATIVGTVGYIAPEQMSGNAIPASDLYSLGATLVRLLTGRKPHDLPMRRMRLEFRQFANISPEFANFLDLLLAPEHEDRPPNAATALQYLHALDDPKKLQRLLTSSPQETPNLTPKNQTFAPPTNSKITVQQKPGQLQVTIPFNTLNLAVAVHILFITVFFCAFLLLLNGLTLVTILTTVFAPSILYSLLLMAEISTTLNLDTRKFTMTNQIFGHKTTHSINANQFIGLELAHLQTRNGHQESLETLFDNGLKPFGKNLTPNERSWLIALFDQETPKIIQQSPTTQALPQTQPQR